MSDTTPDSNAGPQRDKLSDHAYDGIQEYDNPTPGWWVWLFVCSVIFAAFYFVYFHSSAPNRSIYDRLADDQGDLAKKKLAALGITSLPPPTSLTERNMLEWMGDSKYTDYGRSVFKQNCVSCHGPEGQGLVGPNLTDDYYKNIKKLTDIPRVISTGANNGAMPSWERLGSIDVDLVAAYVATLRGKNLPTSPGIPATYGDIIPPWPPIPEPATTTAPASK